MPSRFLQPDNIFLHNEDPRHSWKALKRELFLWSFDSLNFWARKQEHLVIIFDSAVTFFEFVLISKCILEKKTKKFWGFTFFFCTVNRYFPVGRTTLAFPGMIKAYKKLPNRSRIIDKPQKYWNDIKQLFKKFFFLAVSSLAPGTRIGLSVGFHQVPP